MNIFVHVWIWAPCTFILCLQVFCQHQNAITGNHGNRWEKKKCFSTLPSSKPTLNHPPWGQLLSNFNGVNCKKYLFCVTKAIINCDSPRLWEFFCNIGRSQLIIIIRLFNMSPNFSWLNFITNALNLASNEPDNNRLKSVSGVDLLSPHLGPHYVYRVRR